MKHIFTLFIAICLSTTSFAFSSKPQLDEQRLIQEIDLQEAITHAADKEDIDVFPKMSFKEKFIAKKITKKIRANEEPGNEKGKSQVTALILDLLLGTFGAHRFYLGYTGAAIGQLALLISGIFLGIPLIALYIWLLIDTINLATGKLKPKNGEYTESF